MEGWVNLSQKINNKSIFTIMKTLKNILSAFALVALFTVSATAQTTDNATVTASATIVGSLTVTNVSNLAFGDILTTDTPTISSTTADAGAVSVAGATTGQVMNITIDYPAVLTDGTNNLTFDTYTAALRNDGTNDATGASALAAPSGTQITDTYTAAATTAYIYVGGTISNASAGVAGNTYNGTITVTVSYN